MADFCSDSRTPAAREAAASSDAANSMADGLAPLGMKAPYHSR